MGTIDIMPCVQAPITVSLPHFLHGDPSLLEMIGSGLHPDEAKHEFFLNTELVSEIWLFISGQNMLVRLFSLKTHLFWAGKDDFSQLQSSKRMEFNCSSKITAAPLIGAGRIQLNIEVEPVKEIPVLANLPQMIFPIIWIDESAIIPDVIINIIKYGIHT